MGYNLQPRGAAHVFAKAPPEAAKAVSDDRKAMSGNLVRLRPGDATSAYRSYLRRIANMVDEHEFLFGVAPCVADFAAYHGIWYTRTQVPLLADILNATPSVGEWAQRVEAIGHGPMTKLDSADAIAIAAAAEPAAAGSNLLIDSAFQDDHGIPLGTRVTITPEIFGTEPTEGDLIAATRTHYSLRREDSRAGVVHVHFPRIGYVLRPAQPS
jgi:glutathione S-transferase